jgi:hypothetical protein
MSHNVSHVVKTHTKGFPMPQSNEPICDVRDAQEWAEEDALAAPTVPYSDQLACAKRELRMRQQQYPVWVRQGKMTQAWCDLQLAHQGAIIHTLERLVALYEAPAQASFWSHPPPIGTRQHRPIA